MNVSFINIRQFVVEEFYLSALFIEWGLVKHAENYKISVEIMLTVRIDNIYKCLLDDVKL